MTDLEMLVAARANLLRAQERLNLWPDVTVFINDDFGFNLSSSQCIRKAMADVPEPYLKCYIKPDLLRRVVSRQVHWNDCEVSGDILFDRRPNKYAPDVHTLMSFFQLPRPA